MPWCTRSEIRQLSDEAQKIYDDVRRGRLVIHAHAHDGYSAVAAGTYRDTGRSVYLHGENHLRQITDTFDSPTQALTAFHRTHGTALRPGPAPMTDTERQTAHASTSLAPTPSTTGTAPQTEQVPAYAADPGDHEALLNGFLDGQGDWEKYRTWEDHTTVATHESLTLRILFDHEAGPRDPRWTIAAYESPVSERMWYMTLTPTVPVPVLKTLLDALGAGDAWETALGSPITDKQLAQATQPLTAAGWRSAVDGHSQRWNTQQGDAGVQFDTFAAHNPQSPLHTWTLWAGPDIDSPTWAIRASAYTPAGLLADLAEELAHGTGTRQTRSGQPRRVKHLSGGSPAAPLPPHSTRLRR
ncbi:DUF317 domain-containing protein [Streptomyces pseudovenezuelae]|uniref:DUF317 domain-containing protein n=1 Tax=Streptomyces pseudovenezuelae TaxID=67350 RepID=UPI002E813E1C|nr:DUF317 domain-containing protein [Streptomyces pseudovenezuelae]WUA87605.1 DUF317 domain-containing protein [Streptomyces pseudovenezuelae]